MPLLKQIRQHKILLDTHIWLWVMTGDQILSKEFRNSIEHVHRDHGILISPMSVWEIGMLVEKKRLELDMETMDWIDKALDMPGVRLSPVTPRIAIESTRLSGEIHGDPVDRILIATAHEENAVLITCDQKILEYGLQKYISVYNPKNH